MKLLSTAVCLGFLFTSVSAQRIHLNVFGGVANYQGDLQEKVYTFKQAHAAFGLGAAYELSDRFMFRAGFTLAKVSADDKFGRNAARNLTFTSNITEGHAALEFYLRNPYERSVTPYIFSGVAVFHFDPFTTDSSGKKAYLKPLSTEGQGFVAGRSNYKLTQFAIPFGAGLKFSMSDNFRLGLEVGFRKTFNDYLDDVSTTYADENLLLAQRGSRAVELAFRGDEIKSGSSYPAAGVRRGGEKYKDWYYFSGITASFRLSGADGGGGKGGKGIGCPTAVF